MQSTAYRIHLIDWTPSFSNEVLLFDAEHIQCMVYGLNFAHLYEPARQIIWYSIQNPSSLLLWLRYDLQAKRKIFCKTANKE